MIMLATAAVIAAMLAPAVYHSLTTVPHSTMPDSIDEDKGVK